MGELLLCSCLVKQQRGNRQAQAASTKHGDLFQLVYARVSAARRVPSRSCTVFAAMILCVMHWARQVTADDVKVSPHASPPVGHILKQQSLYHICDL